MKDVFTRFLKVCWFFNLIFAAGIILITIISGASGELSSDIKDISAGLTIFISVVPALVIIQYILLGSFYPMRLLEKERRYPR